MYLNLRAAKQGITKNFNKQYSSKIEARKQHHFTTAFDLGFLTVKEAIKTMGRVEFLKIANVNAPSLNGSR